MTRRRQMIVALALGMTGLFGISLVAMGEGGGTAAIQAQYSARLAKLDQNKPDDVYALAKWCLSNGLTDEARTHALAALEKAPDDVRPKFLLYSLAGPSETGTGTAVDSGGTFKKVAISDEAATKIFVDEGSKQMIIFGRDVQPILITKCGSPKCHGSEKNGKWALITQTTTDKRVIAENFQTINKYVNRDSLPTSPLLVMPVKGTEVNHPAKVFPNTNDKSYGIIEVWAKSLKTAASKIWTEAATSPTPTVTP